MEKRNSHGRWNNRSHLNPLGQPSHGDVFLIHTGSEDFTLSPSLEEIGMSEHHLFVKPVIDLDRFVKTIQQLTEERDRRPHAK